MDHGKVSEVAINFTNYCNRHCRDCFRPFPKARAFLAVGPDGKLDAGTIRNLQSAIGRKTNVIITGGGEPTLHPHFHELVKGICSGDRRPQELQIVTNGTPFLTEESSREFLSKLKEAVPKQTIFSVSMSVDDNHARGTLGEYGKEGKWPELIAMARNFHHVANQLDVAHAFNCTLAKGQKSKGYDRTIRKAIGLPMQEGKVFYAFDVNEIVEGLPKRKTPLSSLPAAVRKSVKKIIAGDEQVSRHCVDATGEVYHSEPSYLFQNYGIEDLGKPIGSVASEPLADIVERHQSMHQKRAR